MIPTCITEDLKNGMGLEDCLLKYNTNLKILFQPSKNQTPIEAVNDWSWIRKTPSGSYRLGKIINGNRIEFGTYYTHEDVLSVRNELMKCDWDKDKLPEILEKLQVKRKTPGGYRR